jgi:hypothetical protein
MSSRTAIVWAAGPGAVLPVEKFLDIVCAFHPNQYSFIREAHDMARTRIIAELLRERLTDVLPTESIEIEPPLALLMAQLQDSGDDDDALSPRTAAYAPSPLSR